MAASDDILVAYPIFGGDNICRLTALVLEGQVLISIDHAGAAEAMFGLLGRRTTKNVVGRDMRRQFMPHN